MRLPAQPTIVRDVVELTCRPCFDGCKRLGPLGRLFLTLLAHYWGLVASARHLECSVMHHRLGKWDIAVMAVNIAIAH